MASGHFGVLGLLALHVVSKTWKDTDSAWNQFMED